MAFSQKPQSLHEDSSWVPVSASARLLTARQPRGGRGRRPFRRPRPPPPRGPSVRGQVLGAAPAGKEGPGEPPAAMGVPAPSGDAPPLCRGPWRHLVALAGTARSQLTAATYLLCQASPRPTRGGPGTEGSGRSPTPACPARVPVGHRVCAWASWGSCHATAMAAGRGRARSCLSESIPHRWRPRGPGVPRRTERGRRKCPDFLGKMS